MKKILFLIALTICTLQGFSQHRGGRGGYVNWLTIAVKGGGGTFMMLNQDLKNTDNLTLETFSPSYCFGGRLGVVFGNYVGVSFEYLGGGFKQKYSCQLVPSTVEGNFDFKATDMLALVRYTGEYGFYAELGPKFTTIKKAEYTFAQQPVEDVKPLFKEKNVAIAFGMGFMPYNGDRVQVSIGARAAYGFKDMVEDDKEPFYDLTSQPVTAETKNLNVQILLEVNYFFAKFGTANCGRHGIEFFK
ncbi:MAG: hypothetical protein J5826_00560 [Bacteroidales bacterium]|nr:hypothetical protein [Bacteroidales bacterium]